jgi:putative protease
MGNKRNIELLVTANNLEEIKSYGEAGADAFLIGDDQFAIKSMGCFTLDAIAGAIKLANECGKSLYLLVNALYHNDELAQLEKFLLTVSELGIDAVLFEDPAVYNIVKEQNSTLPLHLSSGSMITSSGVINFWGNRGVRRAELARELTFEEIIAVREHTKMELTVQVYGRTAIFYSKRQLVSNYLEYIDYDATKTTATNSDEFLFLREHERPERAFPLMEDKHGTHLFSDQVIDHRALVADLIKAGINVLKIDGMFIGKEEMLAVIRDIRKLIDQQLRSEGE